MLRSIGVLAATGVAGFVALKLVSILLLPLLGMFLGLVMWVLKIALIIALIYFGYHLFQRLFNKERPSEA